MKTKQLVFYTAFLAFFMSLTLNAAPPRIRLNAKAVPADFRNALFVHYVLPQLERVARLERIILPWGHGLKKTLAQLTQHCFSQNPIKSNQALALIEALPWSDEDGSMIGSDTTIAYKTFMVLRELAPATVDFFDSSSITHWVESVYGESIQSVPAVSPVIRNPQTQRFILNWILSHISSPIRPRPSAPASRPTLGQIQNFLTSIILWQYGHPGTSGWELKITEEVSRLRAELSGLKISPTDDLLVQTFLNEDMPAFFVSTVSRKIYRALLLLAPNDVDPSDPSQLSSWITSLEQRHQSQRALENQMRRNISELSTTVFPILLSLHERVMGYPMKKTKYGLATPNGLRPFLMRLAELTIQETEHRTEATRFINDRVAPAASTFVNNSALYEFLSMIFPGFRQNGEAGISEMQRLLDNTSSSGDATSGELALFSQNVVPLLISRLYDMQLNLGQSREFFLALIERMAQKSPDRRHELLSYLEGLSAADIRDARKGTRLSTLRVLKLMQRLMDKSTPKLDPFEVDSFLEEHLGLSFERRFPFFSMETFTGIIFPRLRSEARNRSIDIFIKNGLRDLLQRFVAESPLSELEKQDATQQMLALNLREHDGTLLATGSGSVAHRVFEALMILVQARRLPEHTLTTEAGWNVLLNTCEGGLTQLK